MRIAHSLQRIVLVALTILLVGWTGVEEGAHPRSHASLAPLPDGKVLIAGGSDNSYNAMAFVDVYDPLEEKFLDGWPSMTDARLDATSVRLPDGRIFVIGGRKTLNGGMIDPVESAEIFDPWTRTWALTTPPPTPRASVLGVLLQDGRVFVKPIDASLSTAFLYDPKQDTWGTTSPGPTLGSFSSAVLLANGLVFIVCDVDINTYDPNTDLWTAIKPPDFAVPPSIVAPLPDGRVFFQASSANSSGHVVAMYSPFDKSWTPTAILPETFHGPQYLAAPLADGQLLLVTQGFDEPAAVTYRLADDKWDVTARPAGFTFGAKLMAIDVDNSALLFDAAGAERFQPSKLIECTAADDCASGHCVQGICCESACKSTCHSCSVPGFYGQCIAEPIGMDLHAHCSEDTCIATCNGKGECIGTHLGDTCAPASCMDEFTALTAAVCQFPGVCAVDAVVRFDCSPYRCSEAGRCANRCSINDDCRPGYGCNHEGRCVLPPLPQYGGCLVAHPDSETHAHWFVLACALAVRLRRRPLRYGNA